MLEKILLFMFPRTIQKMITNAIEEANIVYQYGSMENYYQMLNKYAEDARLEEKLERQRIEEEMRGLDEFLKANEKS